MQMNFYLTRINEIENCYVYICLRCMCLLPTCIGLAAVKRYRVVEEEGKRRNKDNKEKKKGKKQSKEKMITKKKLMKVNKKKENEDIKKTI